MRRRDRIIRESSRAQAAEEMRIAREGLRIQRRSLHATCIMGVAALLLAFSQVRHVIVATVSTLGISEKANSRLQVAALGTGHFNQSGGFYNQANGLKGVSYNAHISDANGGGSWPAHSGPGGGPPGSGPGGGPPE